MHCAHLCTAVHSKLSQNESHYLQNQALQRSAWRFRESAGTAAHLGKGCLAMPYSSHDPKDWLQEAVIAKSPVKKDAASRYDVKIARLRK